MFDYSDIFGFIFTIVIGIMLSIIPYVTEKSAVFGVRVQPGQPVFRRARREYLIAVLITTALLAALQLTIFLKYALFFIFSPFILIGFSFIIYLIWHYRILNIKKKEHWEDSEGGMVLGTFVVSRSKFPLEYAIPGIIILATIFIAGAIYYPSIPAIIATHYGANGLPNQYSKKSIGAVFSPGFIGIGITAFMYLLSVAISRTSLRADSSQPDAAERAIIFRNRISILLLLIPVFMNSTFLLSSLEMWDVIHPGTATIIILIIPILILLVAIIPFFYMTGQLGSNLKIGTANKSEINQGKSINGQPKIRDDDKYWRAGVIYVNSNDNRILVPKRFGEGYTLNFGNKVSIILFSLIIAIAAIILIIVTAFALY
ncbi:MAG: DUF1648 domain-containing protein [Ferroplasma sp.]